MQSRLLSAAEHGCGAEAEYLFQSAEYAILHDGLAQEGHLLLSGMVDELSPLGHLWGEVRRSVLLARQVLSRGMYLITLVILVRHASRFCGTNATDFTSCLDSRPGVSHGRRHYTSQAGLYSTSNHGSRYTTACTRPAAQSLHAKPKCTFRSMVPHQQHDERSVVLPWSNHPPTT